MRQGPLAGIRVVEFAGLGPGPFCCMLLADLGAEVVCIGRPGHAPRNAVTSRGRHNLVIDLKRPESIEACLALLETADALVEGFRPGVMERLGLGPDAALERNPRLVYGRMTGWGQAGPYARRAGHDINYIAVSGALHAIGPAERPVPPLNLVGDFGGGALYLAFGIAAALLNRHRTGRGQVVDAAITDGTTSLLALQYGFLASGVWTDHREANHLDGGRPYYGCYQCQDGKWLAVGPLEQKFYAIFEAAIGLSPEEFPDRQNPRCWPALRARIAERVATRPRDEWTRVFEPLDACVSPVMSLTEAPTHPHNIARQSFVEVDGVVQPAPAPRFSETPGAAQPTVSGTEAVSALLKSWGVAKANRSVLAAQ